LPPHAQTRRCIPDISTLLRIGHFYFALTWLNISGIKAALRANILEFREAVRNNKKIAKRERDIEAMKKILNPEDRRGDVRET